MPYHITLDDYTPSARLADAGVWTQVRYQYSASRLGPWTTITTEALDPIDLDPTLPLTRDLDVIVPDEGYPGWLRVVFLDADGSQEPTDPVYVGSAIRPTVQEVANLMPDRTMEDNVEAGTFTVNTNPTATQVEALIDLALDAVDPDVFADATTEKQRAARTVIALDAAILTEVTYFSNEGEVSQARIAAWQDLIARHTASAGVGTTVTEGGLRDGTAI